MSVCINNASSPATICIPNLTGEDTMNDVNHVLRLQKKLAARIIEIKKNYDNQKKDATDNGNATEVAIVQAIYDAIENTASTVTDLSSFDALLSQLTSKVSTGLLQTLVYTASLKQDISAKIYEKLLANAEVSDIISSEFFAHIATDLIDFTDYAFNQLDDIIGFKTQNLGIFLDAYASSDDVKFDEMKFSDPRVDSKLFATSLTTSAIEADLEPRIVLKIINNKTYKHVVDTKEQMDHVVAIVKDAVFHANEENGMPSENWKGSGDSLDTKKTSNAVFIAINDMFEMQFPGESINILDNSKVFTSLADLRAEAYELLNSKISSADLNNVTDIGSSTNGQSAQNPTLGTPIVPATPAVPNNPSAQGGASKKLTATQVKAAQEKAEKDLAPKFKDFVTEFLKMPNEVRFDGKKNDISDFNLRLKDVFDHIKSATINAEDKKVYDGALVSAFLSIKNPSIAKREATKITKLEKFSLEPLAKLSCLLVKISEEKYKKYSIENENPKLLVADFIEASRKSLDGNASCYIAPLDLDKAKANEFGVNGNNLSPKETSYAQVAYYAELYEKNILTASISESVDSNPLFSSH